MATIGFVLHGDRPASTRLAQETATWLTSQGHHARTLAAGPAVVAPTARANDDLDDLDLVVSLGGDGTMLRTVDLASPSGIPVLGVNLGHLGYLAAVEPEDLPAALEQFLAGSYQVEQRMTLDVDVRADGQESRLHRAALNEVVLQRSAGAHTVRAEMSVNGEPFLTFVADSIIVATPTGSTAYNLSARGPIVSPRARVQVVTPVAPHMLFDRSLVLDASECLSLEPTAGFGAEVVVDGWTTLPLLPGEIVSCRQGDRDALLVTFGDRDFHRILKRKFNLADR